MYVNYESSKFEIARGAANVISEAAVDSKHWRRYNGS